jgi:hypothetical protein
MRGGKHVATRHSPDNDAFLRLYRAAVPVPRRTGRGAKGHR